MTLRLVGAGLPRTATKSLQLALERLLGGRCFHMHEVFAHLDHVPVWRAALRGEPPVWNSFLADYVATVDWPASAFCRELAGANPDDRLVEWRPADGWRPICEALRLPLPPDPFPHVNTTAEWLAGAT